jgi:uncharacterized spore protein YtfJ
MNVNDLMKRVGENLSVNRSFGAAYEKDGVYLIPVALVAGGGGGGGAPFSSAIEEEAEDASTPGNDAGGAGFGGVVLPVGSYVIKDGEVRWVPAVNVTLIVLVGLSVLRLLARSRTHRRRHG